MTKYGDKRSNVRSCASIDEILSQNGVKSLSSFGVCYLTSKLDQSRVETSSVAVQEDRNDDHRVEI